MMMLMLMLMLMMNNALARFTVMRFEAVQTSTNIHFMPSLSLFLTLVSPLICTQSDTYALTEWLARSLESMI